MIRGQPAYPLIPTNCAGERPPVMQRVPVLAVRRSLDFIVDNDDDPPMRSQKVSPSRLEPEIVMKQEYSYTSPLGRVNVCLADPHTEIMPGVPWGAVDLHGTPAHRARFILNERIEQPLLRPLRPITLAEAVGSLLLEGPGYDGLGRAAHEKLRSLGAFGASAPSEAQLMDWLEEPLVVEGHQEPRCYGMTRPKAKVLAHALQAISEIPNFSTALAIRDWLAALPGIDHLTASYAVSYVHNLRDVAVINDLGLLNGRAMGMFPLHWTLERDYVKLEARLLEFCGHLGLNPSELQGQQESDGPSQIAELERRVESMKLAHASAAARASRKRSIPRSRRSGAVRSARTPIA